MSTTSSSLPGTPAEPATVTAPVAVPIARRTGHAVASDGVRLYFEICGAGPPIVFIHGLGGNHAVWFQQVAFFAGRYTVVTMSQRGFAPSAGDLHRYDVGLLVRDVEAVMDAACVERAAVIGQSLGGWSALGLAMRSPDRVGALVLADTLGGIDDETISAHMRLVTGAVAQARSAPPALGVHPALSAGFSARRPDLAYLYQTLATFGSPPPEWIAKQLATARVPAASLATLRVPTLFVVGSEDRLFPPSLVRHASTHVAGAEVVEIQDAGHSPYFEQSGAWNEAVASFLERHP